MYKTKNTEVTIIPIAEMERHPDNRPLGLDQEHIDNLAKLIKVNGFRETQAITVRRVNGKFQIIEGEHRVEACKVVGLNEVPCMVEKIDDTEARLRLITGNTQKPPELLEIGLNVLAAIDSGDIVLDSQNGLSVKNYATRLGKSNATVGEYKNAAMTYQRLQSCMPGPITLLRDIKKLRKLGQCNDNDLVWLHKLILDNDLSKPIVNNLVDIIKSLGDLIIYDAIYTLFDILQIKKTIADQLLTGRDRKLSDIKPLISTIQDNLSNLETEYEFHSYDIEQDAIVTETANLQDLFTTQLGEAKITKQRINQVIKSILSLKRTRSKDQSEADAKYYREETHQSELKELRRIEQEQKDYIFNQWLACYSPENIAKDINLDFDKAKDLLSSAIELSRQVPETNYHELDFTPPIYNVWKQQNLSNQQKHFGNSEVSFVDRLLYLYTEPFDIVVDPFAGGGSTVDICKSRNRRHWVSDRKPTGNNIRQFDILNGLPDLGDNWQDVSLVYLDPPYWRQAKGQYSTDSNDLANMELPDFYKSLVDFIDACSHKIHNCYIALIIQPTQWSAPGRQVVDHVTDIIAEVTRCNLELKLHTRVSVPYESQQCTPQMVEWAKDNKQLLVISREIIVWKSTND